MEEAPEAIVEEDVKDQIGTVQVISALAIVLMAGSIMWLFATVQQTQIDIALINGAGHPFSEEEVRELSSSLSQINSTLARMDQILQDRLPKR